MTTPLSRSVTGGRSRSRLARAEGFARSLPPPGDRLLCGLVSWTRFVVATTVLVACSSYAAEDPVADGGASSSGGGGGGTSSGTSSGSAPGDGGTAQGTDAGGSSSGVTLKPGEIQCGDTAIVCNVRDTYCCLNVSGTDSAAGRSYNTTQAKCEAIEAGTCGAYIGIGDDFSIKLPQSCTSSADCADSSTVCCVLSAEKENRFSKRISGIACVPAADCDTKGRHLCTEKSECLPVENCLPETDPVLSHIYGTFCH